MGSSSSSKKIKYSGASNNEISIENEEIHPKWKIWKMRRYVVAVLIFFGYCNSYMLRVNMSVAIVGMTENRTIVNIDGNITYERDFNWDSKQQGFILSSFFYGYISTLILGGMLASRFGGKCLFGTGIGVTALLTLITPFATKTSFYLLLSVRILKGVFEGIACTSMHEMLSKWAPPLERCKLLSISFSGAHAGTVIAMPMCAYLSEALGWTSIFYVTGGLALLWLLCWCIFVAETPDEDPFITTSERKYIKEALAAEGFSQNTKHPWKSILTSVPILACTFAHFTENWGVYTMLTQLPRFLKDVLNFDLGNAGIMSGMPYLAMTLLLQITGYFADLLISTKIFTITQVRKLFCCGSFMIQAMFLLLAVYLLSPIGTSICLILGVGLGGCAYNGFSANYLDIAPQHAGVIVGIANTIGSSPGIISPILTGYIVKTSSAQEWSVVFFVASGIYLLGAVIYGVLGSAELQPWAKRTEISKPLELQPLNKLAPNVE